MRRIVAAATRIRWTRSSQRVRMLAVACENILLQKCVDCRLTRQFKAKKYVTLPQRWKITFLS